MRRRVEVGVDEAGMNGRPARVDDAPPPVGGLDLGHRADGGDDGALDGDGPALVDRALAIHGDDISVADDEVASTRRARLG